MILSFPNIIKVQGVEDKSTLSIKLQEAGETVTKPQQSAQSRRIVTQRAYKFKRKVTNMSKSVGVGEL